MTFKELLTIVPGATKDKWKQHADGGGWVHVQALVSSQCTIEGVVHAGARICYSAKVGAGAEVCPGAWVGALATVGAGARVGERAKMGDRSRVIAGGTVGYMARVSARSRMKY
jgi:UDP-3-O-[3-hydroxymyristoyl] glucosamine N-acyltransferase